MKWPDAPQPRWFSTAAKADAADLPENGVALGTRTAQRI
jgi:hypothetical protein